MLVKRRDGLKLDLMNTKKKLRKWNLVKEILFVQLKSSWKREQLKFAITDHAEQLNHLIHWQDAKILDKDCDSDVHHIREYIWIRRHAPNTTNGDEGPTT